ncbi:RcpC/CpaB family pilus assembly protein [Streptomyces cucumeris]|uniref:RcpC/CpaB family pilus assembly protein n=1 Tax=Streptomyces cucumeris TaxID=2962890 RepID=UPI003D72A1AC
MSHPSPALALPRSAPPLSAVPRFAPVRIGRDGGHRLRRAVRRRRRPMAAGLALTAAALAAAAPPGQGHGGGAPAPVPASEEGGRRGGPRPAMVAAPVRIADAAAVELLHPGDRVDVLAMPLPNAASAGRGRGAAARVVAPGVRVARVPGAAEDRAHGGEPTDEGEDAGGLYDAGAPAPGGEDGALVVLTVPRATAVALAGAAATSRLAVTLCPS